ncbi:N,N'-diacetylbacillosaminyl-diphospho-undecaprenol alpha-1,3-N-acetylgalactosaminyltransferase [Campylobacter geochelonis]|uniref:Galactosyltransferase n=1 Tax=Campylobacter geochelonis TaxID=1780362 RepID=A0A128EDH6_9BACT|nr:N,N'-diacetylbacillosaminyl-diphospho-undecaprenol alpha-1,3-N-acetylgalactosaminyltransferase [Campylobacter geochelonis]QKF71850.1 N,N'-diacetylbacillosaminyl-diphospho-undecaprenol alpha-1,3-N-acetylgalactosaminyltransferase [Campylobacter geochelonis]CZE47014.1 galactosyltransferase [Campylobacter geochelonis]CZE47405.1 galactosyltransferase [Campylobacter geochelonis]
MARIGFLSHADMSLYFFRAPIMRELAKMGHEVFAIAPKGAYTKELEKEFNTVTYELDKASINPFKVFDNNSNLKEVLKSLNLDMLQTSAHKSNVFGTFVAKDIGIKVVLNLVEGLGSFYIDSDFKTRAICFIIERLYKKAFSKSNGCIFVNDSDPDYMISKNLIDKNKVFRIKSVGVNSAKFDNKLYKSLNLSDKKVVLMMGRAMWHKGVREFYEAAKLLKHRKDCVFVFVGEGYEGNKSSANEAFLKDENVMWLGWRRDICELYKSAYMFVLPSYKEGFPITVLEAMSMSLPVVVSDCDGCVEAVKDGANGLICKMKDSADLASKIESLLDDENMAKKMGENGRNMVLEKYDEKIIVEKYIEIYKEFIDV